MQEGWRDRRARKLHAGESVYLETNDGVKKRDKLAHQVAGPFLILKVNKNNTLVNQRGAVVETISSNLVTRAPSSAKTIEPGHSTRHAELEMKNNEGETGVFKKILSHQERDDESLYFMPAWEGHWEPTWEPREYVPE